MTPYEGDTMIALILIFAFVVVSLYRMSVARPTYDM